jgi:hypothetical protein
MVTLVAHWCVFAQSRDHFLCRHAPFRIAHDAACEEPFTQGQVAIVEQSTSRDRELMAALGIEVPKKRARCNYVIPFLAGDLGRSAHYELSSRQDFFCAQCIIIEIPFAVIGIFIPPPLAAAVVSYSNCESGGANNSDAAPAAWRLRCSCLAPARRRLG